MAQADKYQLKAMPTSEQLGNVDSFSTKKGPAYSFDRTGEYPVINFTSAGGASVSISYTPASMTEQDGQPVAVPASYTATVDGVAFNTSDKHCPGKIKTVIRQAVRAMLHASGKANGTSQRSAAKVARDEARAAQKAVLAKL